jgi:hypothetical protein
MVAFFFPGVFLGPNLKGPFGAPAAEYQCCLLRHVFLLSDFGDRFVKGNGSLIYAKRIAQLMPVPNICELIGNSGGGTPFS